MRYSIYIVFFCNFAVEMNKATKDFIREHADEDVRQLALQAKKKPEVAAESKDEASKLGKD